MSQRDRRSAPKRPARSTRRDDVAEAPAQSEKLQKVLAGLGVGSRRQLEGWIEAGRVTVNGEVANLGQRVIADDRIRVDGRPIHRSKVVEAQILLLNKADGVVCTRRDPEGRPTCFDDLPRLGNGRWINIGRLDINTSGVLLLTNDGTLAHRMMHPSTGLDREYAVRVDRELTHEEIKTLKQGVLIDDFVARFSDVRYFDGTGHNHWYHVVLMEGRNREVRRLFESQGVRVSRLKRVRFGPVVLPSRLRRGRWMELNKEEVLSLYKLLRLPAPRVRDPGRGRGAAARDKRPSVLVPYPELPDPKQEA